MRDKLLLYDYLLCMAVVGNVYSKQYCCSDQPRLECKYMNYCTSLNEYPITAQQATTKVTNLS